MWLFVSSKFQFPFSPQFVKKKSHHRFVFVLFCFFNPVVVNNSNVCLLGPLDWFGQSFFIF